VRGAALAATARDAITEYPPVRVAFTDKDSRLPLVRVAESAACGRRGGLPAEPHAPERPVSGLCPAVGRRTPEQL